MSEVEAECRECSRQYSKLLSEYWTDPQDAESLCRN